jgi:hypothetical protein
MGDLIKGKFGIYQKNKMVNVIPDMIFDSKNFALDKSGKILGDKFVRIEEEFNKKLKEMIETLKGVANVELRQVNRRRQNTVVQYTDEELLAWVETSSVDDWRRYVIFYYAVYQVVMDRITKYLKSKNKR